MNLLPDLFSFAYVPGRYKAVYGCFDRNKRQASMLDWYFRGFSDELSP